MSLLDKASLIVTPNAYKESKLYSVVPNTTLGDMDVVRATTATRVNSAGLIEVVPRNLLANSNNLNNFNQINATKTDNVAISPSGLNNASSLMETATTTFDHYLTNTTFGSINNSLTYSVYLKQNGRRYVQLATVSSQGVARPIFDLQNGVYVSNAGTNPSITTAIENVGNGWFRCSVIHPSTSTNLNQVTVILQDSATYQSYLGDVTKGVFVYGTQLEQGSTATEYFPTTTRLNIPRIDYTNGSCPSLLVEPQRTNLLLQSNVFNSTSWSKYGTPVINSGILSPDGTNNAFELNMLVAQGIYQNATNTAGTYACSIYIKGDTNGIIGLIDGNSLPTQTVNVTTEWKRVNVVLTKGSSPLQYAIYRLNLSHLSKVYIYGAQCELGAYPTSYIPTVASSVTRNADVISKTGISSLIGQTEGTIFVDIYIRDRNNQISASIQRDGTVNAIYISQQNSKANFIVRASNSSKLSYSNEAFLIGRNKAAITYNINGTFKVFLNGVKLTQTSISSFTFSSALSSLQLYDDNYYSASNTSYNNSTQLYKTALSDTECIQLTTL